jgi:phage-related protein
LVNFPRRDTLLYRTPAGESPVEAFLDSLTGRQAQKVVWVLRLVTETGLAPAQYYKKLSGAEQIWEVRVQSDGDAFRLLGFFDGPHTLVLTNGFRKKARTLPRREIALAERRRREYFARKGEE